MDVTIVCLVRNVGYHVSIENRPNAVSMLSHSLDVCANAEASVLYNPASSFFGAHTG